MQWRWVPSLICLWITVIQILGGDSGHDDQLGESSQFGALQSQGDHLHGSTTTQQSKLSTCWCTVLTIQSGEIKVVVAQHRQCNCSPRLPDNTQLLAVCDQQISKTSCCISCSNVDDLDNLEVPISKTSSSSTEAAPACNGLVFFFLSNQQLDYILSYCM